jgi:ankyrin repeat protein
MSRSAFGAPAQGKGESIKIVCVSMCTAGRGPLHGGAHEATGDGLVCAAGAISVVDELLVVIGGAEDWRVNHAAGVGCLPSQPRRRGLHGETTCQTACKCARSCGILAAHWRHSSGSSMVDDCILPNFSCRMLRISRQTNDQLNTLAGRNPQPQSSSKMSLDEFAEAISDKDSIRVKFYLENGVFDANARLPGPRNPPALVFAAGLEEPCGAQSEIVDLLLRFGARIDDTDDDGRTACHVVSDFLATEVLALLLAQQPDLKLKCKNGLTPLDLALGFDGLDHDMRMSAMLIEAGAPLDGSVDPRRLCAVAALNTSAIRTLLRRGVVVSELRDHEGRTPLHLAVCNAVHTMPVVDMLVNECGVDLEARTLSGRTCLHIACIHSNADAIRFFVAAGANVHATAHSGRTPLHILSDEKCTILLLAAGADVHARDKFGKTPLMELAFQFDDRDTQFMRPFVNVMIAAGADLDAADHNGKTARQVLLVDSQMTFDEAAPTEEVEAARREIVKARLDFVRHRAWQVCIGLQSRGLDALQTCAILLHACGPVAPVIAFHHWWKIATIVKHFKSHSTQVGEAGQSDAECA